MFDFPITAMSAALNNPQFQQLMSGQSGQQQPAASSSTPMAQPVSGGSSWADRIQQVQAQLGQQPGMGTFGGSGYQSGGFGGMGLAAQMMRAMQQNGMQGGEQSGPRFQGRPGQFDWNSIFQLMRQMNGTQGQQGQMPFYGGGQPDFMSLFRQRGGNPLFGSSPASFSGLW